MKTQGLAQTSTESTSPVPGVAAAGIYARLPKVHIALQVKEAGVARPNGDWAKVAGGGTPPRNQHSPGVAPGPLGRSFADLLALFRMWTIALLNTD
ncbi:hypothetical protein SBA3_880022 [Candidatus Sulfopaludibacter sp. SbA3]|nr:hypothetical protein SBA3_880022 [Candidatus Sulfopaludibacter sp. SbA3]